jgi:hypothetical protein
MTMPVRPIHFVLLAIAACMLALLAVHPAFPAGAGFGGT